jgi:hypothetical protein
MSRLTDNFTSWKILHETYNEFIRVPSLKSTLGL